MRTIAITNQKGGSGKTTTAVNLAAALGERGKRVLLVDLDPQGSASDWLGVTDAGRGLLEVLTEGAPLAGIIRENVLPGVSLVPSSAILGKAEPSLAGEAGAETIFREALEKLPEKWDFVLVDCPPSLTLLSVSALVACREVFVPVEAHAMALAGLASLSETVEKVRKRLNPALAITAILACRVSRTRLAQDVVAELRSRFGPLVLKSIVRENIRLAEAPSFHQPVTTYDPSSFGAEDYRAVAKEVLSGSKVRR